MRKLVCTFAVLLATSLSGSVMAQECRFTMDDAVGSLTAVGDTYAILDGETADEFVALLGADAPSQEDVTRVLIAHFAGTDFFGLEIGGCLTPPMLLPGAKPPVEGGAGVGA